MSVFETVVGTGRVQVFDLGERVKVQVGGIYQWIR